VESNGTASPRPAPQKPSAQKFLNWYKRHGNITFEVVDSEAAWARFRDQSNTMARTLDCLQHRALGHANQR